MEKNFQRIELKNDSNIKELHLQDRQYYYLYESGGIDTIGKLLEKTADDLMQIRGFNLYSLKIVQSKLNEYGLQLKETIPKKLTKDSRIENLKLKDNIEYYLKENNIYCISDLLGYTYQDVARLKVSINYKTYKLGEKRTRKLNRKLAENGFALKKSEEGDISEMQIREKLYIILSSNSIKTIKQLTGMTTRDLLQIDNLGETFVKEIQDELKKYGKSLKEYIPQPYEHKEIIKKRKKLNSHTEVQETEIKTLDLKLKTYNKLMRNGIDSIEKLLKCSNLLQLKGIGVTTLKEINEQLKNAGFMTIEK